MEDDALFCAACGAKYEPLDRPLTQIPTFCPRCGERMPEGRVFCPNCGADVRAGTAASGAKAAKKSIRPLVVGIAAVCVVAVLLALLLPRLFSSPRDKFISGQKQIVLEGAWKAVTTAAGQYNSLTSLSTDMTFTATCSDNQLRSVLRNSSIGVKVALDQSSLLLNVELTMMGSPVLSGALTYDKGTVGFYLPEADPNYYVANLAELLDEDGLEELSELESPKIPITTLTRLGEGYFDILTTAVTKDNVKKLDQEIRLEELGSSVKGQLYVYAPKAEDIEGMLEQLAGQLETDQELRGLIIEVVGNNAQLLDVDLEDALDDALKDLADGLRENAAESGKAIEDAGFTWTLGMSKGKVVLDKIETSDWSFVLESDGKGRTAVCQKSGESVPFKLEVENDGRTRRGSASWKDSYGDPYLDFTFRDMDTSKKSVLGVNYGIYEFTQYDETIRMEVSEGDNGGTDHVLTLPEDDDLGQLEITLNTSDEKSTASMPEGKTVDISGYDGEQLQELFDEIGQKLGYAVGGLLFNSYF